MKNTHKEITLEYVKNVLDKKSQKVDWVEHERIEKSEYVDMMVLEAALKILWEE